MALSGSPMKKKMATSFNIFEDVAGNTGQQVSLLQRRGIHRVELTQAVQHGLKRSSSMMPMPLTSSKVVNQIPTNSPKVRNLIQFALVSF